MKIAEKKGTKKRLAVDPLHPGRLLEKELAKRGIKKYVFADMIEMYPSHLADLINGKKNFTTAIALRVEKALNIPAEFWLEKQVAYDLYLRRKRLN